MGPDFQAIVKELLEVCPDFSYICGSFEAGKEAIPEDDSNYFGDGNLKRYSLGVDARLRQACGLAWLRRTGFLITRVGSSALTQRFCVLYFCVVGGGRMHWQLYAETNKQFMEWTMFHKCKAVCDFIEWAHSPDEARKYAMKGDETCLFGPFEWGTKMKQGARTDLDAVANLVADGLDYNDIVRTGLHHTTCAKYERYICLLTMLRDNPVMPPVQWPLHIFNQTVEKPDPKKKKRHLWVAGKTNMGKTYECVKKLGANNICYFGGKKKHMWEIYNNEPVVIFDDVSIDFVEITMLTNTIPFLNNIENRYTGKRIKKN